MVPPQSFDPIRSYDKPDIFLSQLYDNEASFSSLRKTFLSPDELSLSERDSFTQDIKDAMGNHAITDVMVDISTNPFVLLSFLITPPAGQAMKSTGRLFTTQNWNRFLKDEGFWFKTLHTLGVLGPSSQLHGSPASPAIQQFMSNMDIIRS